MQDNQASRPTCYIEFRVHDPERYQLLERFFTPLRDYTQHIYQPTPPQPEDITAAGRGALLGGIEDTQDSQRIGIPDETRARRHFGKPEEWLLALRPADLDRLNLPSHRESIEVIRSWQGLSRRDRRKAIKAHENSKSIRGLADFIDMLKYWQDIEFELTEIEQTDPDKARIRYSAFQYPFKGKVALEELLMFFGFLSILKDNC
ncbi:MAG: hypothetical protein ACFE0Q_16450 [Anaerolineae bacterium]